MPLLTNLDNLGKAFDLTSDKVKFAGSMNREFEERSKTTANSLVLLKNEVYRLAINAGTILLPTVQAVSGGLGKAAAVGAKLAEKYPRATAAVVGLGAGVAGLTVSGIALAYAGTFVYGGWLKVKTLWAMLNVKMAMANAQTVGLAVKQKGLAVSTRLATAAQWAWNAALSANPIGVAVAAAVALAAAGYQVYKHWDTIKGAFADLGAWFRGQDWFQTGVDLVKSLASGMMSVAKLPFDAAKSMLGGIRKLLPFSDAKEGPLSDLTLSGKKIPETLAAGMEKGGVPGGGGAVPGNAGGGQPVITFNQTINLSGGGDPAANREAVEAALRESEPRLRQMVAEMLTGGRRLSYG